MGAGWQGLRRPAGEFDEDRVPVPERLGAVWSAPVVFLVVALTYTAGSAASWLLFQAASAAVFFPPAGITLAALLLVPRRQWVWVLAAAGLVEFGVDVQQGLTPAQAMGFAAANTVEPLFGASVVRWLRPGRLTLRRRADAAVFLTGAAVAGPLAGATIGSAVIQWGLGRASWWSAFGPYWAGDALAVVTLGAAIVGWGHGPAWRRRDAGLAALLVTLTAALTLLGFWFDQLTLLYLPMPVLVAAAFTRRVAVVASCGFVMAFTANTITGTGHGPWAQYLTGPHPTAAVLQLYLAIAVLTGWALAIEITERDLAHRRSRQETTARRQLEALQQVTAGVARAATTEQIAAVLVERGVALISEHGVVAIIDEPAKCWRTFATPRFPTKFHDRFAEISFGDAPRVPIAASAATGQRLLLTSQEEIRHRFPDVHQTHVEMATNSLLVLPLRAGDTTIGAVAFGFPDPGGPPPEVISVAESLVELAGQAVDRARLYEREYDAAHQLQRALLPRIPSELPGVGVGAAYRPAQPAHDVGGDWYDVFALPDQRVGIAVGDAIGHDLHAATVMAQLQPLLRAAARSGAGPVEVLRALDDVCDEIEGALCTTVGYAEYTPTERRLRWVCAGHPPPLLLTAQTHGYLDDGRSQPLGMALGTRPMGEITVAAGSTLVWYSDGLIERRHIDLDQGMQTLEAAAIELMTAARGVHPQGLAELLIDRLAVDSEDDTVVLFLRLDGLAPK